MAYRVEFKPSASDALRGLPKRDQAKVVAKIEGLKDDPRPVKSKKLQGDPSLRRIRSGDYRVVYSINDDVLLILVVRIAHRREVYRDL